MPETLQLTSSESITVRDHSPSELLVEAEYGPGGSPPPAHFHPAHAERFEVLEGELRTVVDGQERTLKTGDVLDVPVGAVHAMWNPGAEVARVSWASRPAGRTLEWFRAIDAARRAQPEKEMPSLPVLATLLTRYDDVIRLSQQPRFVVGAALSALSLVGRLISGDARAASSR
jgi:quercetin dioxygenase-like cupin family protein